METTHNTRSQVTVTKTKNNVISSHQKTFNRLIKKVQDLQNKQATMARELDEALQFYHSTMRPDEIILLRYVTERIAIAYDFYQAAKGFSKKELHALKEFLEDQVNQIVSKFGPQEIPDKVKEVFKAVHGSGYEEDFTEAAEEVKNKFREKFKEVFGEDVDLSDMDMTGSQEDIMRKIFMKMGTMANDLKEKFSQETKTKTKKQSAKEAKRQAVEELQSKSLQSIYKQLARTLHPDLEQDAEKRALKEELMKKLTAAYEKNDLFSLLQIEMEWMHHSVDTMKSHHDDDIKIYNAILKDQVQELEAATEMLIMHPRYMQLQPFYPVGFSGISTLQWQYDKLKQFTEDLQAMLVRLKTSEAQAILKEIIKNRIQSAKVVKSICPCGEC